MDQSNFLWDNILNCRNSHLCLLGIPVGADSFSFAFSNSSIRNAPWSGRQFSSPPPQCRVVVCAHFRALSAFECLIYKWKILSALMHFRIFMNFYERLELLLFFSFLLSVLFLFVFFKSVLFFSNFFVRWLKVALVFLCFCFCFLTSAYVYGLGTQHSLGAVGWQRVSGEIPFFFQKNRPWGHTVNSYPLPSAHVPGATDPSIL